MKKLTARETVEAIIGQASAFSEFDKYTDDAFRQIVALAHNVESRIAELEKVLRGWPHGAAGRYRRAVQNALEGPLP